MIFKKLFCWIVCLSFMATSAMAVEYKDGDFVFAGVEKDTLVKYTGLDSVVSIPDHVKHIGETAFLYKSKLTSITIPDSVISIGERAFSGCTKIKSINLPSTITSIGAEAFYGCSKLESVVIPNSITTIEDYTFYKCKSLTSVTIPNSVISIGEEAFCGCESLKSINLPSSITYMGPRALNSCKSLTSVEIPNSITSIEKYTFYNCTSLTSVSIPESVTSIEDHAFGETNLTSVELPESVTEIKEGTFWSCDSLVSVKTSSSLTSIGKEAFYNCNLSSFDIPNTVTSIGEDAFHNCNIDSIIIPNSVTTIGSGAFKYCSLKSIVIPNSVTFIGDNTFVGCPLTSVTLPNTITSLENSVFAYCDSLKSITIPNSVTIIKLNAFYKCRSLESVQIPESVTIIEKEAFSGCGKLKSINIPNSVESIYQSAFENCVSLEPLYIPSSVGIGKNAFYNVKLIFYDGSENGSPWGAQCHAKKGIIDGDFVYVDEQKDTLVYYLGVGPDVVISDHVNTIGKKAFDENSYIKSVTIPSSVTSIGDYAFYQCRNLSPVTIPSSVASIGKSAFYNVDTIYYAGPATGSPWGAKHHIKAIIDGDFIYGDEKKTVLKQYIGSDSIVVIPDNVVTIGNSVFFNNTTIQSVVIPNSVETIGSYAFAGCTGISRLSVPYTVSYIGEDAFSQVDTVSYGGFAVWQWWETQYWGALNFDEEGYGLYIIHNLEELLYFRDSVKGIARLEADIDLSPVCGKVGDEMVSFTPIKCLKFDGGNHTISNLYINQPDNDKEVALFDTEDKIYKLLIQNLKVTNAYVKGGEYAAGIANNGIFVNCHFEGVVIGKYAGGVSEYGKPSSAYNCSNYGMVVSSSYSSGIDASSMYNCYNRGRIVSEQSAIGLGMYDGYHFNLYNAGSIEAPSFTYINTRSDLIESALAKHRGNLFVLQEMDSTAFLSGAVKDSLNKYVSQNPKAYDYHSDSIPLLQWVQGEDGFPRFEGVDLKPTQGYVVRYTGAIEDYDVALNGTVALPVCQISGNSYVFSNNFDGKNIVSDTTIIVEMAKKDSIWGLEMRGDFNADGYISLSFYTNMDNEDERFYGIRGDFYTQNEIKEYFFVNSYLFSKAGVICDYVQESDSIWKVTLDSIYYSIEYDSLALYVGYYDSKVRFNTNVLSWTKGATGDETSVSTISNLALEVYADDETIHVVNAQPNTKIQVFDMNGKVVASGVTDAEGSVEMKLPAMNGVYVVSDGNQSTKVVVK